jgi:hypothetical protein
MKLQVPLSEVYVKIAKRNYNISDLIAQSIKPRYSIPRVPGSSSGQAAHFLSPCNRSTIVSFSFLLPLFTIRAYITCVNNLIFNLFLALVYTNLFLFDCVGRYKPIETLSNLWLIILVLIGWYRSVLIPFCIPTNNSLTSTFVISFNMKPQKWNVKHFRYET